MADNICQSRARGVKVLKHWVLIVKPSSDTKVQKFKSSKVQKFRHKDFSRRGPVEAKMSICATAGLHSNQVSSKNTIAENST